MIKEAFQAINAIDHELQADILEISVKQSQMVFSFYDELIVEMSDLKKLDSMEDNIQVTDITCFQNQLYVAIRDIEDINSFNSNAPFFYLYKIIVALREVICTCPALEYVISKEYLKVFIDLPNIKLSELYKLKDSFNQDPFVEFSGDRPYLLFINESMYVTQEIE